MPAAALTRRPRGPAALGRASGPGRTAANSDSGLSCHAVTVACLCVTVTTVCHGDSGPPSLRLAGPAGRRPLPVRRGVTGPSARELSKRLQLAGSHTAL